MVVSNRNLLFKGSIFRGYVSFRDGTPQKFKSSPLNTIDVQSVLCWYRSLWLGSTEMASYSCSILHRHSSVSCVTRCFSKDVRQHPSWQQGLRQGMFEDEAVRIDHQSSILSDLYVYIIFLPYPPPLRVANEGLGWDFLCFFQSNVILVVFSLASWGWDPTYHVYRQELPLEMSMIYPFNMVYRLED